VPYYQGKTLRFVVGFGAGGGYDTYARLVARHIGKHLPGNPDTVVENKPGGGSLVSANDLYNRTDPDGLTIGVFNGALVFQQALGLRGVLFEGDKFGWIGAPSSGSVACAVMGFTGLRTWEDVLKSTKEIKMGSTGPGANTDDMPKLLNKFLGTKFKVVPGYEGSAAIRRAMQAKEVDGICFSWESMRTTARALLDAKGPDQLIPVLDHGTAQDPEVKDRPQPTALIKDPDDLAAYKAWAASGSFARPFVLAPRTPREYLLTLRRGFLDTLRDSELLEEAKKAKLEIDPVPGEELETIVATMLGVTPKAKEALQFLLPGR
jgi:tripartite-type tricarboxylate transporter receptor subunit TctC